MRKTLSDQTYWLADERFLQVPNVIEIKKTINKGEYVIRHEMIDMKDYGGGEPMLMKNCYSTTDDSYMGVVGSNFIGKWAQKYGLKQIQASGQGNSASIGFSEAWPGRNGKPIWAGWSHRAVCSFGIGDMLFEEEFGADLPEEKRDVIPFVKHGTVKIENMEQAKQAAKNFAASVS